MVLLVVDIQKGITDERLYQLESFIANVTTIIDKARENHVEVIYVQHDDGPGTGFSVGDADYEIADQVSPAPGEKIYTKEVNSAFSNKELDQYLKDLGENTVMIIGLQTNFCIDATIKSAFDRGYKVIVPQGTNSTFDNDYMTGETTVKYYNEDVWEEIVESVTMEEAIEMMGR